MPRNPSGDAGPDVVPSSTSTAASNGRPRGPKRPPRPARPSSSSKHQDRSDERVTATANGTSSSAPTVPVEPTSPPPGFAGSRPTFTSPPAVVDPTVVEGSGAAVPTEPPEPAERRSKRKEPQEERATDVRGGRRVTRVVRRVELWSVLKLSLFLFICLYVAVLGTIVVVWGVAYSSGQVERLQEFLADVGLDNFRFYGDRMFRAVAAIGAVGVLAATILAVLTTALVNLISEMTGGIRVVVIEEDRVPKR